MSWEGIDLTPASVPRLCRRCWLLDRRGLRWALSLHLRLLEWRAGW